MRVANATSPRYRLGGLRHAPLAVARGQQESRAGWAARFREAMKAKKAQHGASCEVDESFDADQVIKVTAP